MEEVLCSDKQYDDRKELIRPLERCAKNFHKEIIINLRKSIPGRLLKVTDVKRAESHLFNFFYSLHMCDYLVLLSGRQSFVSQCSLTINK